MKRKTRPCINTCWCRESWTVPEPYWWRRFRVCGWLWLSCPWRRALRRAASATQTALRLGGVLLAYVALRKLTNSFADVAAAFVAWKRIAPLFRAAGRPEPLGECAAASRHERGS